MHGPINVCTNTVNKAHVHVSTVSYLYDVVIVSKLENIPPGNHAIPSAVHIQGNNGGC